MCLGSPDPEHLPVNVKDRDPAKMEALIAALEEFDSKTEEAEQTPTPGPTPTPAPAYPQRYLRATMFEPELCPDPQTLSTYVKPNLSQAAWNFLGAQAVIQNSEYRDLLIEKQKLQELHIVLSQRYRSFKPVAIALNKEWFIKEGKEGTEQMAGLLEEFKAAGGGVQEMHKVQEMLEIGLGRIQDVKMKIVMLRDEIKQYLDVQGLAWEAPLSLLRRTMESE